MHTKIAYNFCITIIDEQFVCQMAGSGKSSGVVKGQYLVDFYLINIFL